VPRRRVDLPSFDGVQGLLTPTKVTNFFGLVLGFSKRGPIIFSD
jgi:hypothetical protein